MRSPVGAWRDRLSRPLRSGKGDKGSGTASSVQILVQIYFTAEEALSTVISVTLYGRLTAERAWRTL